MNAVVRLLIENGADVAAMDKGGRTALQGRARSGHEGVVRRLLEKGGGISRRGINMETRRGRRQWRAGTRR